VVLPRQAGPDVAQGTNPLAIMGRIASGIGMLLAVSGAFAHRPMAADSQLSASESMARTPITPIHPAGEAVGRKPASSATPVTRATLIIVWIMLPGDVAVEHGGREIAMVRNLAMIPSLMSVQTDTAVATVADATVIMMMPGAR